MIRLRDVCYVRLGTRDLTGATRYATDVAVSNETNLGLEKSRSALSYLCQIGRAMFDWAAVIPQMQDLFAELSAIRKRVDATGHPPVSPHHLPVAPSPRARSVRSP